MTDQSLIKLKKLPVFIRPKFGQKVHATARARKIRRREPMPIDYLQMCVTWEQWVPEDIVGIYVGYRDVREGTITFYDDGDEFKSERSIRLWLIIPNERTNPIYVFPDDVELLDVNASPLSVYGEGQGEG